MFVKPDQLINKNKTNHNLQATEFQIIWYCIDTCESDKLCFCCYFSIIPNCDTMHMPWCKIMKHNLSPYLSIQIKSIFFGIWYHLIQSALFCRRRHLDDDMYFERNRWYCGETDDVIPENFDVPAYKMQNRPPLWEFQNWPPMWDKIGPRCGNGPPMWDRPPMWVQHIYLILFALPEHLHMLMTSIIVTGS